MTKKLCASDATGHNASVRVGRVLFQGQASDAGRGSPGNRRACFICGGWQQAVSASMTPLLTPPVFSLIRENYKQIFPN